MLIKFRQRYLKLNNVQLSESPQLTMTSVIIIKMNYHLFDIT